MIANTYLVPAAIQQAPYVASYIFLCNPQTNQWGSVSYYDNFQMRKLTYEEIQKCYQNTKVVCNNMLHTRHIIIYINVFSYNNSNYNITALSINPVLCPIQHLMLQCFPETFSLVYNTLVLSSCGKAAKGSRGGTKDTDLPSPKSAVLPFCRPWGKSSFKPRTSLPMSLHVGEWRDFRMICSKSWLH